MAEGLAARYLPWRMGGEEGFPVRRGEIVAGRYRIDAHLGKSAVAFIVAAQDEQTDDLVALS
jgi:hypothetical protein